MIHSSGPRRAQTMVNKEEKMNIKQNETNLKTNELIHVAKNEQLTEKQTIETEVTEKNNQWDREHYLRQHQPWGQ